MATQFVTTLLAFIVVGLAGTAYCEDLAIEKTRTKIAYTGVADADDIKHIAVVAKERALDFPVLWDHECLFNHSFFGLRFGTDESHTIKFYYGTARQLAALKQGTVTALAEIPLRNGILHGKVRRWNPDGKLLLVIPYVDGKMHGECRFYSQTGNLLGTSQLENGTGTYRVWDASKKEPTVSREDVYVDGKIVSQRQISDSNVAPNSAAAKPATAIGRSNANLWAAVSVGEPIVPRMRVKRLVIHFALQNDGKEAINPRVESWRVNINGTDHPDSQFTFANGPRDDRWESLPAGDYLRFTYVLGDWFKEPGTYKVVWKGDDFESAPVFFRVLP